MHHKTLITNENGHYLYIVLKKYRWSTQSKRAIRFADTNEALAYINTVNINNRWSVNEINIVQCTSDINPNTYIDVQT
jgi:hypothetical protein